MPAVRTRVRTAWQRTQVLPNRRQRLAVTAHWSIVKVAEAGLDRHHRRRGLGTAGPDFGPAASDDQLGYVPTGWLMLRRMFRDVELGPSDAVLEYGAGLGRATLWLARRYSARRCVGVEIDADLVRAAQGNLGRVRERLRCKDVTFVAADARAFDVPDDVTVVYLFNPFIGATFERVLDNVIASLERAPRSVQVFYYFPIMHESLVARGFECTHLHRHLFFAWAAYRWTPGRALLPGPVL